MEEEEIELWYEEQKQRLSEEYISHIDKGMPLKDREAKFNRAMEELNSRYYKKHSALKKKKEDRKRRAESKARILAPFVAIGMLFVNSFRLIGHAVGGGFKTKYGGVKYNAEMLWIKKGYKITDGTANTLRPVYYWYVKYLQPFVLAVKRPFIKMGRFFKKKAISIKDFLSYCAAGLWKSIKLSFKYVVKHFAEGYKRFSAKKEELSKRYHDWQTKRVQAHLDKKHHKKEEKEKKKKEREERKKKKKGKIEDQEAEKEGGEMKQPGEAPDVESTV